MSRRREVNDEEATLWRTVTRTIKPLKGRRSRPIKPGETKPVSSAPKAARQTPPLAPPVMASPRAAPKQAPALAPLDRRDRQKLSRGTQAIDARLDLHGRTQSQAHTTLLRFLRKAQDQGAKTVLVITGKGALKDDGAGERGVLKRQVPLWLSLPEFRSLVVGFGDAAIGHGGEGALYVRVRRTRSSA